MRDRCIILAASQVALIDGLMWNDAGNIMWGTNDGAGTIHRRPASRAAAVSSAAAAAASSASSAWRRAAYSCRADSASCRRVSSSSGRIAAASSIAASCRAAASAQGLTAGTFSSST
jgi:hypothetical protein